MKELVVISGKGGTGKTSITASFAVLADRPVIADCDVDAADLHLVLSPQVKERHDFRSGNLAIIRPSDCIGCGLCMAYCRFNAVSRHQCGNKTDSSGGTMRKSADETARDLYRIEPSSCEGCGVCVRFCPSKAIDFPERLCGEWMVSETRTGPMVHARLGVAAENSGKLVTTVRNEARRIAEEQERSLVLVDGPPGIGCPVIASLAGASMALILTEPTVSGEHDLIRVLALVKHFGIPASVCVNKWDLNISMTENIEKKAREAGAEVAGRIRYDNAVTNAQMQALAVVEIDSPAGGDMRRIWGNLNLQESKDGK